MLDFLFELKFSNTMKSKPRIWLNIKGSYQAAWLLYNPFLTQFTLDLPLDTKPSRCISSPYTDRRFSPTVPLKEYMYLRFKHGKITDIPGLYFDMGIEYYGYGIRIYKQTSGGMKKLVKKSPKTLKILRIA